MAAVLIWLTLSLGTPADAIQDRFDIIELNHVYDDFSRPKFVQLVFWNWLPSQKSYVCEGYYMLDDCIKKTEEGKKAWDKKVEKALERVPALQRAELIVKLDYRGEYHRHSAHPVRLWAARVYRSKWIDKGGNLRAVIGSQFRATHTYHDREVADREFNPVAIRRRLTRPQ